VTARFVPGLELARDFGATVVRPLLRPALPGSRGGRFAAALRDAITDPRVRRLPPWGAIDQFTDNADAAGDLGFLRACAAAALQAGPSGKVPP
jgi:hypothetical protein